MFDIIINGILEALIVAGVAYLGWMIGFDINLKNSASIGATIGAVIGLGCVLLI